MEKTHLEAFLDAMHRRDPAGLNEHMSDAVVLRSPFLPQPFEGKAAVGKLLGALLGVADSFEVTGMLQAGDRAAVFITIRSGEVSVDGVDDMRVDGAGLVDGMTIHLRPLPAIVAMQQRLAPAIGAPVMTLVPA